MSKAGASISSDIASAKRFVFPVREKYNTQGFMIAISNGFLNKTFLSHKILTLLIFGHSQDHLSSSAYEQPGNHIINSVQIELYCQQSGITS
jgi:hypothetical protein